MKLNKFLQTLDGKQIVAIGCTGEGNHSYVYIGEAGNWDLIKRAFEDYRTSIADKLERCRSKIEHYALNPVEFTGKETEEERTKKIFERADYMVSAYNSFRKSKNYLETYRSPSERNVKDDYPRNVDGAIAVLIEGKECGDFWFKSEFDKKYGV